MEFKAVKQDGLNLHSGMSYYLFSHYSRPTMAYYLMLINEKKLGDGGSLQRVISVVADVR